MPPKRAMVKSKSATAAYQIVPGYTRCPVIPDGNCFYTTMGFFSELDADSMRKKIMDYMTENKAFYSVYFESEKDFLSRVKANRRPGVWNSDICDIVPQAASQMLKRTIIVHNYTDNRTFNLITFEHENPTGNAIHVFRKSDHYEILLDNTQLPNKNIIPFTDDICSSSGSVSSASSVSSLGECESESVSSTDEDPCLIKFI
jgi:hypothetical protein